LGIAASNNRYRASKRALYDTCRVTCRKGRYEKHKRKASYILSELCMEFTEPEKFRKWLESYPQVTLS